MMKNRLLLVTSDKMQTMVCERIEGREGVKWELGFAFFRGWEMGFCVLGLGFMKQKQ